MTAVLTTAVSLIAGIPLLAGIGMIVYSLNAQKRARHLRSVGVPASGVVVDNQMTSWSEGRVTFSPVITFQTAEGRELTVVSQQSSHRSYVKGSPVELRYDPERPEKVILDREGAGPWILMAMGAVFILFALVVAGVALAAGSQALPGFETGPDLAPDPGFEELPTE
jgi:hypothetical protein